MADYQPIIGASLVEVVIGGEREGGDCDEVICTG